MYLDMGFETQIPSRAPITSTWPYTCAAKAVADDM